MLVKPWYDPNSGRSRLTPIDETTVKQVDGGSEFKGLYARCVVPAIIPLNVVGIKNITPPPTLNRIYAMPPAFDAVKAGIPLMITNLMPHAFCPIL